MNKKEHLKRDIILISVVSIVVLVILIISLVNRKVGDVAYVKYDDETLFIVDLNSGKYESHTTTYLSDVLPKIDEDKLIVNNLVDERLVKGDGVIVYQNHFFIMGELGYIHIEYSSEKKMIRVTKEKSPYKICSGLGYSNSTPIICLPNRVTIVFDNDVDILI